MKRVILLLLGQAVAGLALGQVIAVEGMLGNRNYYYQHNFTVPIAANSRFAVFHTSSLHALYDEEEKNEVMSQTYITYSLQKFLRLAVGTFYASKPGISPSASLQVVVSRNNFRAWLVPRVDLKEGGSFEGMTLLEFIPPLRQDISLYIRTQLMTNYGPRYHNRSYQNFRAGIRYKTITSGLALNVDERGREKQTQHNVGFFLQYVVTYPH